MGKRKPYRLSVSPADGNRVCVFIGDPNDLYEGVAIWLDPGQVREFVRELSFGIFEAQVAVEARQRKELRDAKSS